MRIVKLTRGYCSLVSEEDADLVELSWWAFQSRKVVYAQRVTRVQGPKQQGKRSPRRYEYLHREVLRRVVGRELHPGEQADHINRDSLDNRRCNIRLSTQKQNTFNRGPLPGSQSRYKGVSMHKASGLWKAQIQVDRVNRGLGYFRDQISAARAYDKAAKEHFGEFAYLNEVD